jgi:H/ACA ribonucleoprotein complex subunit 2
MCEDNNIPYIFVTSRALLGEASATKRPTSVVMINKERNAKANVKDSDVEEFEAAYKDLLKLVIEASRSVRK